MNSTPHTPLRRSGILLALIIAGEAVFLLPFVLPRIFRPTLLAVFELSNTELGGAFSAYGWLAVVSYLLGGPLADRYPARRLMAAALAATGLGGIILTTVPTRSVLTILYACWGMTTILLFWAALIRATREWGGAQAQGRAYGLLDGGRGLFAALLASGAVWLLGLLLPQDVSSTNPAEREAALRIVIWVFTGFTLGAAGLVWWLIPDQEPVHVTGLPPRLTLAGVWAVAQMPVVWLQAGIVVCAYVGYKSVDTLSLYAREVFGYDEVSAAGVSTIAFWVRPAAALVAGWLGDRFSASRVIVAGFGLMGAGCVAIANGWVQPGLPWTLTLAVITGCIGIFAIRGVYFALFEEAQVPLALTGSAAGLVSMIGFTPDVFMGPMTGFILDGHPGAAGHLQLNLVLAGFTVAGLVCAGAYTWLVTRRPA
ncbi:MAG: MFS transporter [Bacteroidia bacterium]|nr:MFS transporter [Bacteroidia bacterium]